MLPTSKVLSPIPPRTVGLGEANPRARKRPNQSPDTLSIVLEATPLDTRRHLEGTTMPGENGNCAWSQSVRSFWVGNRSSSARKNTQAKVPKGRSMLCGEQDKIPSLLKAHVKVHRRKVCTLMTMGRSHPRVLEISFAIIKSKTAGRELEYTQDMLEECKGFRLSLPKIGRFPLLQTTVRNLCNSWTGDECSRCGCLLTTKYRLLGHQKSCGGGTDSEGHPPFDRINVDVASHVNIAGRAFFILASFDRIIVCPLDLSEYPLL